VGKNSKIFLITICLAQLLTTSCASIDWSVPGSKSYSDRLDQQVENNWSDSRKSVAQQLADFKREDPKFYKSLEDAVSDDRTIIEVYKSDGTHVGTGIGH
jgi:hypothetical protein